MLNSLTWAKCFVGKQFVKTRTALQQFKFPTKRRTQEQLPTPAQPTVAILSLGKAIGSVYFSVQPACRRWFSATFSRVSDRSRREELHFCLPRKSGPDLGRQRRVPDYLNSEPACWVDIFSSLDHLWTPKSVFLSECLDHTQDRFRCWISPHAMAQ